MVATDNLTAHDLSRHVESLDEESVHELRKCTKQLRARLQLHRHLAGPDDDTESLRGAVKDLARQLAGRRNQDVLRNLLDTLIAESGSREERNALARLRDNLASGQAARPDPGEIRKLVSRIAKQGRTLDAVPYADSDIDEFLADRLLALAVDGPPLLDSTDWEGLHDWRKQVKKLYYQFQLKQMPGTHDRRAMDILEALGGALGDINDLCMLERHVHAHREHLAHDADRRRLLDLVARRRRGLLGRCRELFSALQAL